jgi:hypothetical protein
MQIYKPRFWALAAIVLLSACNGTDKKTDKKTDDKAVSETKGINATRLEGTWICKRVETGFTGKAMEGFGIGHVYRFKDSTISVEMDGIPSSADPMKVTDTSFTYTWNEALGPETYHYSFKGDTLVIYTIPQNIVDIKYLVKK